MMLNIFLMVLNMRGMMKEDFLYKLELDLEHHNIAAITILEGQINTTCVAVSVLCSVNF